MTKSKRTTKKIVRPTGRSAQQAARATLVMRHAAKADVKKSVALSPIEQVAASAKGDLSIPAFLDVNKGKSKEDIEKTRDELIEKGKKISRVQHNILRGTPAPKSSNLTDHDKQVIAGMEAAAKQKTAEKKAEDKARLAKLAAETKAKRAEIAAVKKAAKEANKPEPKTKAKPEPKTAKVKSAAKSKKSSGIQRSEKGDAILNMLKLKNGASNSEMMDKLGFRWTIGAMKKLCKGHGYKLTVNKPEGENMRYVAEKQS